MSIFPRWILAEMQYQRRLYKKDERRCAVPHLHHLVSHALPGLPLIEMTYPNTNNSDTNPAPRRSGDDSHRRNGPHGRGDPYRRALRKKQHTTGSEDAFGAMMRRAAFRGSACDLDGIVYRRVPATEAAPEGIEVLLVLEHASARAPHRARHHYLRDLLEQGGTRRNQGRLLLHLARMHACPALFVIYEQGSMLCEDDRLWVCRLDKGRAWKPTSVQVFSDYLRSL